MLKISEILEEYLSNNHFLAEMLNKGLVNTSALAREMHAYVEKRAMKEVTVSSIVMALNRLVPEVKVRSTMLDRLNFIETVTVRGGILDLTYENSDTIANCHLELTKYLNLNRQKGSFFNTSQGLAETTVIFSSEIEGVVRRYYAGEKIVLEMSNLSAITIRISREATVLAGAYYSILKKFAWEGINIVELLSTYTELTILVEKEDLEKAFAIVNSLENRLA